MKSEILENEKNMMLILENKVLDLVENMHASKEYPDFDYVRLKSFVSRMFFNEMDYITREPNDYYELYLEEFDNEKL